MSINSGRPKAIHVTPGRCCTSAAENALPRSHRLRPLRMNVGSSTVEEDKKKQHTQDSKTQSHQHVLAASLI